MTDIRLWTPGKRMISTPGCRTGLFGADLLPSNPTATVYLCEGEWDAIALRWLMKTLLAPNALVVGVPGAGTFKNDWAAWLSGRTVRVCYDNDSPGIVGEVKVHKRLKNQTQALTFTHWPSGLPEGFDVRDWVKTYAVQRNEPKKCWDALHTLFRTQPRQVDPPPLDPSKEGTDQATEKREAPPKKSRWKKPPSLQDVFTTFDKWLYLESMDAIIITLAVHISQQIDGPPVWLFLVGPPGSAKTETLTSLAQVPNVYMTSTLTPHALISGANWKDNVDPSLIPRLDGKVMVIKDFTSILAMRDVEKDEIFGILRDAYDGRCGKVFGTGIERTYESRFTVLAAVTPRIHDLSQQHTSLGERFLKFAVGDNLVHSAEEDIIARAIENISQDTEMKAELQDVVHAFVTRQLTVSQKHIPAIPPPLKKAIIRLSRFGARMRGTVSRDNYKSDIMTSRPSAEVGSRLGVQLAKLAKALAIVLGNKEVGLREYQLVAKTMVDTIPQRTEDVLRAMLELCPTPRDYVTAAQVANKCKYPIATVSRILQDMNVLEIVSRIGTSYKHQWTLTPYIRDTIASAGLYGHPLPSLAQPVLRVRRRA